MKKEYQAPLFEKYDAEPQVFCADASSPVDNFAGNAGEGVDQLGD